MTRSADVAIIGAGMAGASVAYELAEEADVVVVEAEEQPGYHATGRSAALWARLYGHPVMRTFSAASLAFLKDPPDGFSQTALLTPRGVLMVAPADQDDGFHHMKAEAAKADVPLRDVSGAEAREMVPILTEEWSAHALYDDMAFDIEVHGLLQGYVRGARQRGATFLADDAVVAIDRNVGGWTLTTRRGDRFAVPVLVNAAGAWADAVAGLAGVGAIGLTPKRRTGIIIAAPEGVDVRGWPAVGDMAERFYFKPDAGKLMVSPADATPVSPQDAQAEEMDIAVAADRYMTATGQTVHRVEHAWAGLRTFAPDEAPVIGFDPTAENFFWLAGQGGTGIQTAPALARFAAALLTGGKDKVARAGISPAEVAPDRLRKTERTAKTQIN